MRHIASYGIVLFTYLLFGCGNSQLSNTSDHSLQKTLNLIVMGGNSSCRESFATPTPIGSGMQIRAEQIMNEVAPNKFGIINYIWTCYLTSDPTIFLIDSSSPDTVKAMEAPAFFHYLNQFVSSSKSSQDHESVTTYIAGHSYGGWLAMQSALNADFGFEGLYTLDPISRVTCTFDLPFGCTTAPGDIDTNQRQIIADKTTNWHNFYQTRTFYLHSSAIEQADRNTLLPVTHTAIDTDRRVWDDMESYLMQILKSALES